MENLQGPMTLKDSLKAAAIAVTILEDQGNYKDAYKNYVDFSRMIEVDQANLLKAGAHSADLIHEVELEKIYALKNKTRIIWSCVTLVLLLALIGAILYYRYRITRTNHQLARKEQERLLYEREKEKERVDLEREKTALAVAKLNNEMQTLVNSQRQYEEECEFLNGQNMRLTSEIDLLKELLNDRSETEKTIQDAFRARMGMLNSLLATEISHNEKHAKKYNAWLRDIRDHKSAFLNSTRLVFSASHPEFMDYLQKCGLTPDEIEYVCLFGLGLNGKEIGEFMDNKHHYIKSSEIRKKFGLTDRDTNLGNFIRQKLEEEGK